MKMFKKLMAVALAGVMALVVLTGCASNAVSTKEIMANITDNNPISIQNKSVTLKAAAEDDAVKVMQILQAYKAENKDAKMPDGFAPCVRDIVKKLDIKENEYVGISAAKIETYQSKTLKEMQNADIASALTSPRALRALQNGNFKDGSEGTISMKIDKIGDDTYIIAVIRVPAAK